MKLYFNILFDCVARCNDSFYSKYILKKFLFRVVFFLTTTTHSCQC